MLIDLSAKERLLICTVLSREEHQNDDFASVGGPAAAELRSRAAEARELVRKLQAVVQQPEGEGSCVGCGGHAHRVVDGDRSWVECTHCCGWSTEGQARR